MDFAAAGRLVLKWQMLSADSLNGRDRRNQIQGVP